MSTTSHLRKGKRDVLSTSDELMGAGARGKPSIPSDMKEIGMIMKHGTSGEKENRNITMSQPLAAPLPVIQIPVKR
jgi:hypothetical protein